MSVTNDTFSQSDDGAQGHGKTRFWGLFWLGVMIVGAAVFFREGIEELLAAWTLPEYSHGPLIPILSGLLFLRQLKDVPVNTGPVNDRWPGFAVLIFALLLGAGGKLIGIGDIVAYALILWVGAILLISFGWKTGRHFWPPVLHLVYMLPLPGALYYGVSTQLQMISSELGVYFLDLLRVPVFLEGNIIDLGVYKLHVAEACSGLRYLFPILSFSYIFAVLYQGPTWHKAALLLSAVPITILMNSIRIALAGVVVNSYGPEYVEGFSHFFEGWVIFLSCILILFAFAWVLVRLRRDGTTLVKALDLETEGLGTQLGRLRLVQPSKALISGAVVLVAVTMAWQALPRPEIEQISRDPFSIFPTQLGAWNAGSQKALDPAVEQILAADDYHSVTLIDPTANAGVDLFMAWYKDQNSGGVHSPEVCLPGAGWEIARLETVPFPGGASGETLNRAIIQKGTERMLVYYWYEQQGQRTGSEFSAKLQLMVGKIANGRNDSALVRLITPIESEQDIPEADRRLSDALNEVVQPLSKFVPAPR
ncbi:VPLPA-CTERM-specific exosortase XrtD [Aliiroseovarius sp. YM-037]|uniref:VPLPA-CTERM-specific exosortase XrtD n=1 Tax=Aliiroseovarius sp. YM-037 TaxID=3341728 RepID=UPI003A80D67E